VPRSKPVSQREIKAREKFGLGPVAAYKQLRGDSGARKASGPGSGAASPSRPNSQQLLSWDFNEPIEILRIKDDEIRRRCQEELTLACRTFFLEQFSEKQETPHRKAYSLKREKRWSKQRQQYLAELERVAKDGNLASETLVRRVWAVQLPQALEQEVYRLKGTNSLGQSVVFLREQYEKAASSRGRVRSYALTHLVHRLQALASEHRPCLTRSGRNSRR
jgi:hypothetical protein